MKNVSVFDYSLKQMFAWAKTRQDLASAQLQDYLQERVHVLDGEVH